jgi:hypothetical protein
MKKGTEMTMYNELQIHGEWKECQPGYYLFDTPDCGVKILGIPFHVLAIQTTGGAEQVALHTANRADLQALHRAGGSCAGYVEVEIDGHPAVVYLVPYDR